MSRTVNPGIGLPSRRRITRAVSDGGESSAASPASTKCSKRCVSCSTSGESGASMASARLRTLSNAPPSAKRRKSTANATISPATKPTAASAKRGGPKPGARGSAGAPALVLVAATNAVQRRSTAPS
ncbi:hypothetical protein [Streptomyces avermitilis]|uniref:hypothetical protein n=1 Tax=Streptomyces avermitilis TaxID=33903 RepID=UPI0010F78B68|nr:hypothetical protein [Streptomyces avermitilis]